MEANEKKAMKELAASKKEAAARKKEAEVATRE